MDRIVARVVVTACLLASAESCLLLAPDTCSHGETMGAPRLANGIEGTDDAPFLRLQWDVGTETGAELPRSYFEQGSLDEITMGSEAGEIITSSIALTGERELTIHLLPAKEWRRNGGQYLVAVSFPSRADFTGCINPPHDDRYTIRIELELDSAGTLVKTTIDEEKHLQPI